MYTVTFVNYSSIKLEKKKRLGLCSPVHHLRCFSYSWPFHGLIGFCGSLFWTSDLGISISKTVNFSKEMILSVYSYCPGIYVTHRKPSISTHRIELNKAKPFLTRGLFLTFALLITLIRSWCLSYILFFIA